MDKIPLFPEFAGLDLSHRQVIEDYYKGAGPKISELNFSEIFAWHNIRDTKITSHNGNICLFLNKNGKKYFYPPLGLNEPVKTTIALLEWLFKEEKEAFAYGFDEDGAKACEASGVMTALEDRDNADYVYSSDELIKLSGRKFDGKRNHLKRFLKGYEFELLPVSGPMMPEVKDFQQKWCEARLCSDDLSLMNENKALHEVLDSWENLSMTGAVIKIKGRIQAFTAASRLNADTAVVLFEKANPEFDGIYQAINKMFCENYLKDYKWINREQDGGEEGLRKAKLSYNPAKLEMKYTIRLKE
jgi:hypothetical protein